MKTVGEACEQQHDEIECVGSSHDESQMYTGIHSDTRAHKIDVTAENSGTYQ